MGEQKYLFTCYTETDYEDVDNIFLELFKNGIPVKTGKDCSAENIDTIISEAEAVLLVISPTSMQSRTIGYQLQLAAQYNKHVIPYFLYSPDEVMVPSGLYMMMDGSATIPAYEYADSTDSLVKRALSELKPYFPEAFDEKKSKKKSPAFAVFCGVLVCLLIITGYFSILKPKSHEHMMEHIRQSTVLIYNQVVSNENENLYHSGSGFFIEDNGLIATNYHVIEDNTLLLVQPAADSKHYYEAEIVAYDQVNDLALIQINYSSSDYLALSLGSVNIGDTIYVSGYPRGIDLTISNGIVSNNQHYADGLEYLLMTAAVSPGNSGGPVVNDSGKVVGIATAKYSEAENLNMARPVSYLKELIKTANK